MWESRRVVARFPRDSWKEGEACLWLSTLSTAPAFPPFFRPCRAVRKGCQPRRCATHVSVALRAGSASPLTPSTNRRTIAVRHAFTRRCSVRKLSGFEWRWHLGLELLKEFLGRHIRLLVEPQFDLRPHALKWIDTSPPSSLDCLRCVRRREAQDIRLSGIHAYQREGPERELCGEASHNRQTPAGEAGRN